MLQLILILFPNVLAAYLRTSSFLSSSDDPSSSTSLGSLAGGVHNLDKSLSSLSSQLTSSLSSLGLKLDKSQQASASALTSLIDSEIASKQSSLSSLNSRDPFLTAKHRGPLQQMWRLPHL